MRALSLRKALFGLMFGPLLSCSGDAAPRKGQIMLALQTDMNIPTDVSHVRIVVLKNGALKFDQKYRVGKDGEEIPATLGIIASDNPSDTTEVRVLSYQGSKVRTLNRVVTTIPTQRVATLTVPIQWLCDGQVKPSEADADGFDSSCDDPEAACIAGECRKVYVDSLTLPDFKTADVMGGSEDPTQGLCYDTAACLDLGQEVVPDAECHIEVPKAWLPKLNVGLRLPENSGGICSDQGDCYVPLDSNPSTGFHLVNSAGELAKVALPKAVCSKLASGDAEAVRVSNACVTKTSSIPTCGPWTSVGTRNPNKGPSSGSGAGPGTFPGSGGAGGLDGNGGTGGDIDPTGCPGLFEGNPEAIAEDARVDQFARLVLNLEQQSRQVRRSVAEACSRVAERIGKAPSTAPGVSPTDAQIRSVCSLARESLADTTVTWRVVTGGQNCRADVVQQLEIEKGCPAIEACEFGTPEQRCDSPLGTCSATCVGPCLPDDAAKNVACAGWCEGQCVGTCDGRCLGPGGNILPATECMGLCEGTCTGSCEGACVAASECSGLCQGECSSSISEYYCDGPLSLPDCALTQACENLAAATAATQRVCIPGSAFVSGPTPPEVAPTIADNLPALLLADARTQGLVRGVAHLHAAGGSLLPALQPGQDMSCLESAWVRLSALTTSLQVALDEANSLAWMMSEEPDPAAFCVENSADDACATCVKGMCCEALSACASTPGCMESANCFRSCSGQDVAPAECAARCGTDSFAEAFMACQNTSCQNSCGVPTQNGGGACVASGSGTYVVDDFEDKNTTTSVGSWQVTNSEGFLGSLSLIEPGAGNSVAAMGVAGAPDPGISVNFNSCMDARGTNALAFQAISPDASQPVTLTVRIRTRPNELASRGGACSGAQCGDYHLFTTTVAARSFSAVSAPWPAFLDSGSNPPDLSQIIGIDFVLLGSQAQQIVIDDVKFEGPNL